jgi:hypothetical protein
LDIFSYVFHYINANSVFNSGTILC